MRKAVHQAARHCHADLLHNSEQPNLDALETVTA
jgi:hypothetical protein